MHTKKFTVWMQCMCVCVCVIQWMIDYVYLESKDSRKRSIKIWHISRMFSHVSVHGFVRFYSKYFSIRTTFASNQKCQSQRNSRSLNNSKRNLQKKMMIDIQPVKKRRLLILYKHILTNWFDVDCGLFFINPHTYTTDCRIFW